MGDNTVDYSGSFSIKLWNCQKIAYKITSSMRVTLRFSLFY
nr:MAG TPA: hypothetical protein [Caudoviricetes sp.]